MSTSLKKARRIYLAGRRKPIGDGQPVFIIAEAGVNHNGSLKLAKQLVDAAKAAGADAVKFQTFQAEKLADQSAPLAGYQKRGINAASQFEMLKQLELPPAAFKELFSYCRKKGILFLSTPFDQPSALLLNKLPVAAFKISSGDLNNLPLLRMITAFGRPIILSTGMATMAEVMTAVKAISRKDLILLHCTSNYPTAYQNVNLLAMETIRSATGLLVGYSDHTLGIEVPLAAAALGASVIEKHFTLDRKMKGPDHLASLEPKELTEMVAGIRKIEKAMGRPEKAPIRSELPIRLVARKSLFAVRDIAKGEKITEAMLAIKRPGTGIEPKHLDAIVGRRAGSLITQGTLLAWRQLR